MSKPTLRTYTGAIEHRPALADAGDMFLEFDRQGLLVGLYVWGDGGWERIEVER